jgi:hypothetical protein
MTHVRHHGKTMFMTTLAVSCMALVLLWPQWRDELRAQVYPDVERICGRENLERLSREADLEVEVAEFFTAAAAEDIRLAREAAARGDTREERSRIESGERSAMAAESALGIARRRLDIIEACSL